ncbi:MAG: hypothetical protein LBC20_05090 [Planctomycetaceae bacterium]|nr:hypothetical protein [Planctomycetaceae bacterium]
MFYNVCNISDAGKNPERRRKESGKQNDEKPTGRQAFHRVTESLGLG